MDHDPFARRRRRTLPLLVLALGLVAWLTLVSGAVPLSAGDVAGALWRRFGLAIGPDPSAQAIAVVGAIRMPRLLLAAAIGATLAATGAVLQGVLRNDLADPHLLGIGPGAAVGAAIGASAAGVQGAIAGGVVTGVLTGFAVRRLAGRATLDPTRVILSGVALGAALSAWVGFIVFAADRARVPPVEFWLLGSLSGSTWRAFWTVVVYATLALGVMVGAARLLDVLALGETNARHLGIDVDLLRTVLLIASGAAVGATVGAGGIIVFVGLVVPWLMRRLTGPMHRPLLVGSMLGGALMVMSADLVARLALEPVELPVGLVTSAVGGPVFLWLLARRHDA